MTDGEPEPFRMPTDPDADENPDADGPGNDADDGGEAGDEPATGGESIADLINEAARTAAEQAEAEALGEAPEDRSAEVWGNGDGAGGDADAVWQQSEDHAASNVWDTDDEDGDVVWGEQAPATEEPTPPPAADPSPPAAMEGMPATSDELEPETFTFAVDAEDGTPPTATSAPAGGAPDEEPETFSFPAGPEATAPAPVPDRADADEEPEAFSFPVSDDSPDAAASAASEDSAPPAAEWTVPGAGAADGEDDVDDVDDVSEVDDVWTSSVASDDETPLAESATPRDDAGWHDLEAEQEPSWSVPDLPVRDHAGDEEEPASFTAALHDEDVEEDDDDAPWSSPALPDEPDEPAVADEDMPPADVVTAEVHDALGDLLGNGEEDAVIETGATPATPAPAEATPEPAEAEPAEAAPAEAASGGVPFELDHLDDLDDLENLQDMAAAVPDPDEPASAEEQGGDEDADADPAADPERPLDAPTAARQVMEPGSVTFSSGGKKKKRGLFG